jgi:hypothetical protein
VEITEDGSTIPRRRLYSNRPSPLSIQAFIAVVCRCRSLAMLPSKMGDLPKDTDVRLGPVQFDPNI